MIIDDPTLLLPISATFELALKIGLVTFAIVYFIFTLIVVRQINLMTETIMTEGGAILRALAILHAGLAVGVIILFVGLF